MAVRHPSPLQGFQNVSFITDREKQVNLVTEAPTKQTTMSKHYAVKILQTLQLFVV
jgi:hypothetical protein